MISLIVIVIFPLESGQTKASNLLRKLVVDFILVNLVVVEANARSERVRSRFAGRFGFLKGV